jgi:hypothetical protein
MNDTHALSADDLARLGWAHRHLEHPSFAARASNIVGTPIEHAMHLLPRDWDRRLGDVLDVIIRQWLSNVIHSMDHIPPEQSHNTLHKLLAMATGAAGGFLGPLTLLLELPVTTGLMLRSIADIAHHHGENLHTSEARLACMQVFALGGRTLQDKATETGYYGLRITLGFHFASRLLYTGAGAPVNNIPGGVELMRAIATRFGVVVTDSAAAKMIPVAGAVGGALLNLVFMQHFQDVAKGHFTVRQLERRYGVDPVRSAYEELSEQERRSQAFNPVDGW